MNPRSNRPIVAPGIGRRSPRIEVRIDKLVYGGWGLGRHQGKVAFVPFTAPGDRVAIRVVEEKRNYLRGNILELLEPGPDRAAPACPLFGACGGCQWQHVDYAGQVEAKRRILVELFHHRFPETSTLDITMLASPQALGYRSRARLQLRGSGASSVVGFFRGQSDEVEDVPACPLFRPLLGRALEQVRLDRRAAKGDPRLNEIEIAASEEEGSWGASPCLASAPEAELVREVGGARYATAASSFFQANDFMAEPLLDAVKRRTAGVRGAAALDLYCGVGLFTIPLAPAFESVTAVESRADSCRLCEKNAAAAGRTNIRVVCAEAAAWAKAVGSVAAPGYDLVLLDPPREGAGADLMEQLGTWAPETIIYVSCDPQTLCRDLALLPRGQYRIDSIEGLDLFPQTFHFEIVVHLRRR